MQTSHENSNLLGELYELIKKLSDNLSSQPKEWMTIKEGAAYAGVSYNTFTTFREMGLKICEINGVKRVAKSEIDRFLIERSF